MHDRYLEVTYRHGKPLAAYLYLPRDENAKSARVVREKDGLLIDLAEDGSPIGIEILSPREATLRSINEALAKYAIPSLDRVEVAPLAIVG